MKLISLILLSLVVVIFFLTLLNRLMKLFILSMSQKYNSPLRNKRPGTGRKIALHMAIRNENPEIVLRTLDSIRQIKYDDFRVFVIDNNTADETLWKPVEQYCQVNNSKFSFYHVSKLPGFKAGALNFVLDQTPLDYEFISIIDADSIIDPDFLNDILPLFDDPQISHVQTPLGSIHPPIEDKFRSRITLVYGYFFSIYMPFSNYFRITPFTGAMGIIRRNILERVGRWNGFYLTEDMEFSFRVMREGGKSLFVNVPYGKSYLPPDLKNVRKQIFRWTFGNAQIFRDYFFPALVTKFKCPFYKKLFYFSFPGIFINLYFLVFFIIATAIYLLDIFNYDLQFSHHIIFLMFLTLLLEVTGDAVAFFVLGLKEKASLPLIFVNLLFWIGLYLNSNMATLSAAFKKTIPFTVTAKAKSKIEKGAMVNESVVLIFTFLILLAGLKYQEYTAAYFFILSLGAICLIPVIFSLKSTLSSASGN